MLTIFILITIGFMFCNASPLLLSKQLWKEVANHLMLEDDKKFGELQVEFQKISAYENIKEKFFPENKLPWEFFKHVETGTVVIENDFGILPWNEEMRYPQNIWNYMGPDSQKKPFIRCMAHCFDLSPMLYESTARLIDLIQAQPIDQARLIGLIKTLIDANVKVNENVKNVVNKKDKYGHTLLAKAYQKGNEEFARVLIQLGANVNSKNERGATILHQTVMSEFGEPQKKILKMLIEAGADIDAKTSSGSTPLSMQAFFRRPEIARILIEANANIEIKDNSGMTAFDVAMRRDVETARIFFRASEHKNATNEFGKSALHTSVMWSELDFAKMLIEEGADANLRDSFGQTALHLAALYASPELVQTLIKAGADTNLKDDFGRTGLIIAYSRNKEDVVQMFMKHMSFGYALALRVALNGYVSLGSTLFVAATKKYPTKMFLLISLFLCIFSIFLKFN